MEQELRHRVVGHENVDTPVPIVVRNGDPQSFCRLVKAQLMRHLSEVAVAVVVIYEHANRRENVGITDPAVTVAGLTAPDIVPVPRDITFYDQVEQAIVIEIDPGGRRRPAAAGDARFLSNIAECAVAVVMVEAVSSVSGNENIFVPIVVVVGYSDTHAVSNPFESRFFSDVLKRSVGFLMEHAIPVLRGCLLRDEPLRCRIVVRRTIYQEKVEPPIVVAIKERHT